MATVGCTNNFSKSAFLVCFGYGVLHYTYTPSFASSSQSRNIPFAQIQDPSPYIPFQENTMGNNEYHVENTLENDAWEWDDVFLNEALNGEEFRNLDWSINDN
ncbi:hypothetical protein MTR67_018955 [Solanum verrucosum]|uniref:Uncharacterized protein n=1 Tax=Solanum verrucosum TaxID=315347 RepID=A0AAF0TTG5_SOLVR|nr:hypothetical protein MTR67_018955 [Solanum verrucosum]